MDTWVIIIFLLNLLAFIVLVCFERRDPVVSLAWVLGFTVFPVLGFVVFIVFGKGLKKKTRDQYAKKMHMNIDLTEKLRRDEEIRALKDEKAGGEYNDLLLYLLNTNNSIYTDNNDVKIFTDANEKYSNLFEDIRKAKSHINILYFIIRDDEISKKLINVLAQKAEEGVEVRLLYDGFGSLLTSKHIFKPLIQAGGKVCSFFPVKINSYSKINHRNHRKIVVIDNEIGYTGGMNIGDEYMSKKKPSPWRDTHIRIEGEAVMYLQKIFDLDWIFSTGEDLSENIKKFFPRTEKECGKTGIQIVASGPESDAEEIKCGMIKMISKAKNSVLIQTPYFVPDKPFLTAIEMAANSGVDVKVMIPGVPDKSYVYYSTYSFLGELLSAGVKVYTYPGFLHAKTMVSDNKILTIGTSNMDIRSFQLHFEVNAFIYDEEKANEYIRIFNNDLKLCQEITLDDYKKRGVWQQMKEGFFRLFSPIM